MVRVAVVTDSTADMDLEEAGRLGVTMVPLRIRWDGESYKDKVELSIDEFYRRLQVEKGVPRSSQPPTGEFEAVYRQLLKEHDGVISLHISGKLSGTVNAARVAACNVDPDRIAVLDSYITAYPLGALVLRTARLAQEGASLAECVAMAEDVIPRLKLFCILDTLESQNWCGASARWKRRRSCTETIPSPLSSCGSWSSRTIRSWKSNWAGPARL
jgi:DegV family protein with EDD domain